MNKKGVQIAVNFLVILIVAIVLFVLGLTLFYTVFRESADFEKTLSDRTRSRIESVLAQGKLIAIPDVQKEIERDNTNSFSIGVSNEFPTSQYFALEVKPDKAVDYDGNQITPFGTWVVQSNNFGEIQKDQYNARLILITVPKDAKKGTYIFNVYVCEGACTGDPPSNLYTGTFNKIYVLVP
ncbi:MAG: hypothetical protein ABIE94_00375 [archaeon]